MMYSNDWKNAITFDRVPDPTDPVNKEIQIWYNALRPYFGKKLAENMVTNTNGQFAGDTNNVIICPADPTQGGLRGEGGVPYGVTVDDRSQVGFFQRSYGINNHVRSIAPTPTSVATMKKSQHDPLSSRDRGMGRHCLVHHPHQRYCDPRQYQPEEVARGHSGRARLMVSLRSLISGRE